MARRLDEAFEGCEEWTLAPASPRRADIPDIAPWLSASQYDGREDLPRAA